MTNPRFDVAGIGNAIVDVLASSTDEFLHEQDLPKGSMTLIDEARAERLYAAMNPAIESSGGSVANTMAGVASLGGRGAFIGKVRNDLPGSIFRHDMTAGNIHFDTPPLTDGASTARCMVLVTPDSERTMCTYLGACTQLSPEDIDAAVIREAAITYVEGYQWDLPAAQQAICEAAVIARQAGWKFSFSLSDPFCVTRHKDAFKTLVSDHVDILFANEAEILSLTGADDFEGAVVTIQGVCPMAILTRSEKGCAIVTKSDVSYVPSQRVEKPVDSTGAGDQFAAGVLWGLCRGHSPIDSARIGAVCAAEVISHLGARPAVDSLATLVADTLGLTGTPS